MHPDALGLVIRVSIYHYGIFCMVLSVSPYLTPYVFRFSSASECQKIETKRSFLRRKGSK